MGIEVISLIILVSMIGLMLTGMPLVYVTMSIAIGCTLYHLGFSGLPLVASRVSGFVTEYVFVSVPLFVLMACVLERSGVARDLYDAMYILAGLPFIAGTYDAAWKLKDVQKPYFDKLFVAGAKVLIRRHNDKSTPKVGPRPQRARAAWS